MKTTNDKDFLKDFLLKTTNEQNFIAQELKPFFTDIDRQIATHVGDDTGELLPVIWLIREITKTAKKKRKKLKKRLYQNIIQHEPPQITITPTQPIRFSRHVVTG